MFPRGLSSWGWFFLKHLLLCSIIYYLLTIFYNIRRSIQAPVYKTHTYIHVCVCVYIHLHTHIIYLDIYFSCVTMREVVTIIGLMIKSQKRDSLLRFVSLRVMYLSEVDSTRGVWRWVLVPFCFHPVKRKHRLLLVSVYYDCHLLKPRRSQHSSTPA